MSPEVSALAWCITHFGDELYAKARPDDDTPPDPVARELTPGRQFDWFTNVLGGHLIRMTALGRAGRFTMSGLDGTARIPFEPDWFVDGAVVYDALSNAVVVNGKRFGGFEAEWNGDRAAGEDNPAEGDGTNDNDPDERMPTEVEKWMRLQEAKALVNGDPP